MSFAQDLDWGIHYYGEELDLFIVKNELPRDWFRNPDHIAFKAADREDFEYSWSEFTRTHPSEIFWTEKDDRILAVAHLMGRAISLGVGWSVRYVEFMEPRPEKVGIDVVGIDHMEFQLNTLDEAESFLDSRYIPYEFIPDPTHNRLEIPINHQGQELKFTNISIADVIQQGLRQDDTFKRPG